MTEHLINKTVPTLPLGDALIEAGSKIDAEIAARLSRVMWKTLSSMDDKVQRRLNEFLIAEIDSLQLQHEIDRDPDCDRKLALEQLLAQYLVTP